MANKVYTGVWSEVVNAGLSYASNFSIQSVGREIKIKSITISYQIIDPATTQFIPYRTTSGHGFTFTIANTGPVVGYAFRITNGQPAAMGKIVQLTNPGQYLFDCFYIQNEALFTINLDNVSAIQVQYNFSIIIETEESTIFKS